MQKRRLTIILKSDWLQSRANDLQKVGEVIVDYFVQNFGKDCRGYKRIDDVVIIDNLQSERANLFIQADFCDFMKKRYNEQVSVMIEKMEFEKLDDETVELSPTNESGKDEKEQKSIYERINALLEENKKNNKGKPEVSSRPSYFEDDDEDEDYDEECENGTYPKALKECDNLIGCEQFKRLCHEIVSIAPIMADEKMLSVFRNQSYLFSINDGCGLSTTCNILADLLTELNLTAYSCVKRFNIQPKKGETNECFDDVLSYVKHSYNKDIGVVLIDISNWMSYVNDPLFKDFLKQLSAHLTKAIIVFRIPFVEKEVLSDVSQALNDLLFVRNISFTPLSSAEMREYAKNLLSDYGFNISPNAWKYFDERIIYERSDGRFYGMHTVEKVVRELVYKKQLDNVNRNAVNKSIGVRDTKKLISDSSYQELSGEQLLNNLVGAKSIRQRIYEIIAQIELSRKDEKVKAPCIHMRFVGNPGTGKTTVARAIGKLLKEKGILRVGGFFEYHGRNFCGRFIGETAPKTASICRDAYGSVLFIDEAYTLYGDGRSSADYGKEAIDTLISEMENHRSDLLVIMAGYTDDMQTLMKANAGLESRLPYVIEFPNFTREELFEIYKSMLSKSFEYTEDLLDTVKEYFEKIPDEVINAKQFSNARFVRNLFERTWAKASTRSMLDKTKSVIISAQDFNLAVSDKEFDFNARKKNRMGFI